ncbi:MAG: hypothetical protein ACI4QT_09920 [Kiritimatiellia bacterium]
MALCLAAGPPGPVVARLPLRETNKSVRSSFLVLIAAIMAKSEKISPFLFVWWKSFLAIFSSQIENLKSLFPIFPG